MADYNGYLEIDIPLKSILTVTIRNGIIETSPVLSSLTNNLFNGIKEADYQNTNLTNVIQPNMIFAPTIENVAILTTPKYKGYNPDSSILFGTENSVFFVGIMPAIDSLPKAANLVDTIQQQQMVLVPVIADYGVRVKKTYNGIGDEVMVGILNTRIFNGYMNGSSDIDVKIIYRTVGSPRRSPLDAVWLRSKDAEGFIIDEVDGDVDE